MTFMRSKLDYVTAQTTHFIGLEINQSPIDYVALAQGFGVPARRIEKGLRFAPAIEAGIAQLPFGDDTCPNSIWSFPPSSTAR
jgi:thiamine pyrophosphate-dependent acetolactate synthase large subunit-like protein